MKSPPTAFLPLQGHTEVTHATPMKEILRNAILFFLTLEAKAVLARHKPNIIVVTGSVGKTSTKDAVFSALSGSLFVRKSEKSFNSDIGVPLTILGVPNGWSNFGVWLHNLLKGLLLIVTSVPYPKWLVIEVGADRPGDISRSLAWIKPHIVIATRFPEIPVHVEFYASPEAVITEELFPLSRLSHGGTAIVNGDDVHALNAPVSPGVSRIVYGFKSSVDVRIMRYRLVQKNGLLSGVSFDLCYSGERIHVTLEGVVGKGVAYAAAAAAAAALAAGVSFVAAGNHLERHVSPPGRLRVFMGTKGSVIIDDTYNASPAAVEEALHVLKDTPESGRRIAVLGDMLELGSYSSGEHARMGECAAECADILVAIGVRAKGMALAALRSGMSESRVQAFERASDASAFLLSFVAAGDTVLVKGSQGMRMERVVKALMENPHDAEKLLVRQDPEWLAR